MKIGFNIPISQRTLILNSVKSILNGHGLLLCEAMRDVASTHGIAFSLPTGTTQRQLDEKFREMEMFFTRRGISNGQEIFLKFLTETLTKVNLLSNFSPNDKAALVEVLSIPIDQHAQIYCDNVGQWFIKWKAKLIQADLEDTEFYKVQLFKPPGLTFVPNYVTHYLHTAILSYNNGLHAVALALCAISMEATLKDRLKQRSYTFDYAQRRQDNYVSGLGNALELARNQESFLSASHLPTDMDSVIKPIRNNLVHLSEEAFNTPLPDFNNLSPTGLYYLKDFVSNSMMVSDLIRSIILCIDSMYRELRAEQNAPAIQPVPTAPSSTGTIQASQQH